MAELDAAVNAELGPLKLERARFTTQIVTDAAVFGPEGAEKIEFWVQTNPGARPGPMMKVASGGELSRFMLALKVVLADRGSAPTLVFDEIDTGVGGAVADAIGQRLARLAPSVQVLVRHPCAAGRGARASGICASPRTSRTRARASPPASRRWRTSSARGNRAHAGRRDHHRRSAGGGGKPDEKRWLSPVSATATRKVIRPRTDRESEL